MTPEGNNVDPPYTPEIADEQVGGLEGLDDAEGRLEFLRRPQGDIERGRKTSFFVDI